MTVWSEVEEALEEIIDDYERVNHVISLFQDDRCRLMGLRVGAVGSGAALELGCGPGNFSRMITSRRRGPLVCLDYSPKMLRANLSRNAGSGFCYVRAVFEALPFRERVFSLAAASYALRDSLEKPRAYREACTVLAPGGRFLLIDIGKPDNPVLRSLMGLYIRFAVPVMAGLTAGYGHRNPWSLLYDTYVLLPSNGELGRMLSAHLEGVRVCESVLGVMVVATGVKPGAGV